MEIIVSGKTVEKALAKGLKDLNLKLGDVDVEVLDVGERKIFLSRPATVKIKRKSPEKEFLPREEMKKDIPSEKDLLRLMDEVQFEAPKIDGTVEYQNGKLLVTDPKNNGSFAVVTVPPEVVLRVEGKEVKKSAVLTSKSRTEVKTEKKLPNRSFDIKVNAAVMSASIKVTYEEGNEVEIEESPPVQRLSFSIVQKKLTSERYNLSEISESLKSKGIVYGIDWSLLNQAVLKGDGEWHEFAVGTSPIPGKDGRLEMLIQPDEVDEPGDNLSNIHKIFSVNEGEVLAKVIPPEDGKPGMNVYGVTVPAITGKALVIRAGQGVEWMEETEVFVSTSVGRPVVRGGLLEVIPCHVINQDVHFTDGGLRFLGDVVIHGTVHEGVQIFAGGNIMIEGYAYHSTIEAQGSIYVTKQVVGGQIKAGASQVCFITATRLLEEILQTWNSVIYAIEQLEQIQAFKRQDLSINGFGQLLKLLMETKFKPLPSLVKHFIKHYEEHEAQLKSSVYKTCISLEKSILGFGPLQFKSKDDIKRESTRWKESLEHLTDFIRTKEEAVIGSAFNARIEASGNVLVKEWGVENCSIVAGGSLFAVGNPGVIRGGAVVANDKVKANEVGTPGGAKTTVHLPDGGDFESFSTYPNTWVKKGMVEREYMGNRVV
jgi:uncharacterized protein (DUF342 family)